jgi:hypothetical protein
MAYSSLLDALLDNNRQYTMTKTASASLDDAILEPLPGPSRHYAAPTRTSSADSEGSLTEASMSVTARYRTAKTASAPLTIPQLIKFATGIPAAMRELPVSQKRKIASAAKSIKEASARLQRLVNKTAAQMAQDGATKLADYLDASKVPMWAKQACADYTLLAGLHQILNPQAVTKTASTEEVLAERSMTDEEVGSYINKLLNDGVTPKDVEAKLTKLAELQLFNRSFATDKLSNAAGIAGIAFLQPNAYMDSCPSTYERMSVKLGGVRAASVYQVKACVDCTYFQKEGNAKRCNLFQRPIIANSAELMPIINNLTASLVGKNASLAEKKAALVRIANHESDRPSVGIKQASQSSEASFKRNDQKVSIRTSPQEKVSKVASAAFTVKTAHAMHQAGKDLNTIFATATKKVGAVEAKLVVRSFIAGLKGTKTRIALSQIDCTQLKSKLGSSNGILGADKCASCTYRSGMHCGLTGGTLLTYPGMQNARTNHHIAAGAPEDGLGMMKEFDMMDSIQPGDIEMKKPDFVDVELKDFSRVEL